MGNLAGLQERYPTTPAARINPAQKHRIGGGGRCGHRFSLYTLFVFHLSRMPLEDETHKTGFMNNLLGEFAIMGLAPEEQE